MRRYGGLSSITDTLKPNRKLPFEPPSKLQLHAPQITMLIQEKRIVQHIHDYLYITAGFSHKRYKYAKELNSC